MWNKLYKDEMISALSVPRRPLALSMYQKSQFHRIFINLTLHTDTIQGLAASDIQVEIPYPYEYGTDSNVYVQQIEKNVIDVEQSFAGLISGMKKVAEGEIGQLYSRITYDYLIRKSYTDK